MESPEVFAVILAGGSGTRFWPASRRLRPKQLLPLGPSAPKPLITSTLDRLEGLVPKERVYVATGRHLADATATTLSELPDDAFLSEPQAKNTAPCIGWAARVIADKNPDAVVCVLPSDQHAVDEVEFRQVLSRAALAANSGSITTIGIVPTRPETGYGYIQRGGKEGEDAFTVKRFVEKPDRATAEEYLKSGDFLWNAGIFVFRAKDMVAAFEAHLPAMAAQIEALVGAGTPSSDEGKKAAESFFSECESISVDYGIMEKMEKLLVVPGDFGWSDLGSWESALELSEKDEAGNAAPEGTVLVDAKDNLVADLRSPAKKPRVVALVGVEGLCIVETDDALLVMPAEKSQDVRKVVAELKATEREGLT